MCMYILISYIPNIILIITITAILYFISIHIHYTIILHIHITTTGITNIFRYGLASIQILELIDTSMHRSNNLTCNTLIEINNKTIINACTLETTIK